MHFITIVLVTGYFGWIFAPASNCSRRERGTRLKSHSETQSDIKVDDFQCRVIFKCVRV